MQNYDDCSAAGYHNRDQKNNRERYLKAHWKPRLEGLIATYCRDGLILDLGCGTGVYLSMIRRYTPRAVGMDLSPNMIRYIQNDERQPTVIIGDAHHVPFRSSLFDVVVSTGLMEYVDRESVVREMNRVLRTGGVCIIQCANKLGWLRLIDRLGTTCLRRRRSCEEPSIREMESLLERNDFELIETIADDGLVWLPLAIDAKVGFELYMLMESLVRPFGHNPFSGAMAFVARKC